MRLLPLDWATRPLVSDGSDRTDVALLPSLAGSVVASSEIGLDNVSP